MLGVLLEHTGERPIRKTKSNLTGMPNEILSGPVCMRVFVSGRKSFQDELISDLVISLLLFAWLWSGMSLSRDDPARDQFVSSEMTFVSGSQGDSPYVNDFFSSREDSHPVTNSSRFLCKWALT